MLKMVKVLKKDISEQINDLIKDKFKKVKSKFNFSLSNVIKKSFALGGIELGKTSKKQVENRTKALKQVMLKDIDKIQNEVSQNVARTISQAYAQGLPSGKIKLLVQDELNKVNYRIETAVRTNTAYMASISKLLGWAEMGFVEYQWQTGVFDARTRELHKKLNGQVFKIKDALEGRAPIPGRVPDKNGKVILSESINCRCNIKIYR